MSSKCPLCNKRMWFWKKKEIYEITEKHGNIFVAHKKCGDPKIDEDFQRISQKSGKKK